MISTPITTATTQSTAAKGGHHRVPGDELTALLPRIFAAMGSEAEREKAAAGPKMPAAAMTTNAIATTHSTTMILRSPVCCAEPM